MPFRPSQKRSLFLLAALAVALCILSGCRGIFGVAESFTLLAGGTVTASIPVTIDGQIGSAGGFTNVTSTLIADGPTTTAGLTALAGSQAKLRALLPQREVTAASLLAGPVAPGFYHVSGSLIIPDDQTLILQSDGLYVFNVDGSFGLGANSVVQLNEGLQPENVVWNVAGTVVIGANTDFNGIVVAEGDISFGANARMVGRLLSRVGNIGLASGNILDAAISGGFPAAVTIEQTNFEVIPGETVTFPVNAGFLLPIGIGNVALFVKDLPPGATHLSGDTVVDQSGPNGSDFLEIQDLTDAEPPTFSTQFSWVPTIPGTYRFTYFARSESLISGPSIGGAPGIEALDGTIDACTVTIHVGFPTSTVGLVTGGGMWGRDKTFQVTATSRGGRRPLVVGTLQAMLAPGVILRSRGIHTLVRTELRTGVRSVQLFGNASVGRYGVVPFSATFTDGGPRGQDTVSVTLTVDPAQNGGNNHVDFFGSLVAGNLNIR